MGTIEPTTSLSNTEPNQDKKAKKTFSLPLPKALRGRKTSRGLRKEKKEQQPAANSSTSNERSISSKISRRVGGRLRLGEKKSEREANKQSREQAAVLRPKIQASQLGNEKAGLTRTTKTEVRLSQTPGAIAYSAAKDHKSGPLEQQASSTHLVTATLVEEDDDSNTEQLKSLVEEKDSRLQQLEKELAALRNAQIAEPVTVAAAAPVQTQKVAPVQPQKAPPKAPHKEPPAYSYDKGMTKGENFALQCLLTGGKEEGDKCYNLYADNNKKKSWNLFS